MTMCAEVERSIVNTEPNTAGAEEASPSDKDNPCEQEEAFATHAQPPSSHQHRTSFVVTVTQQTATMNFIAHKRQVKLTDTLVLK